MKQIIRDGGDSMYLLEILYCFTKVRGYKTIVKFFPHDVDDLEPALNYLVGIAQNQALWQSHYVFLIWLSIIVLVPFDLETIDTNGDLILKVMKLGKGFLEHTGRPREAASIMIAKLLTRPDIQKQGFLASFFSWAKQQSGEGEMFIKLGILGTLIEIFTHGHRNELLSYIKQATDFLEIGEGNMNLRQLRVKLAGRLALTQLKPIVASWRYHRGSRSLEPIIHSIDSSHIITNAQVALVSKFAGNADSNEGMDTDIDFELLEVLLDNLLQGLRDRDTVVRWSAAKAIGRVTGRLEKDLGDEVVEQILKLFSATESDSAWHGGCLAIAELARRGLLLPTRLSKVFPLVYEALLYDKQQGNHSVGAHVRDAACYVAWSFARAYAPEELSDYLKDLATHLLIVSLFDREINCRRAASAAFQEHVGRQGSFPHGIEILTEADYFTLGNRNHAYLQVSCFVAQYPDYFEALVVHLMEVKLRHWEPIVRQLAACALSVLVPFSPEFYINVVMHKLIPLTVDNNLATRHGAILGVGEILLGLAGKSALNNDPKIIEKMMYKHSVNYYLLSTNEELTESEKKILKDSDNRKHFRREYKQLQRHPHLHKIPNEIFDSIRTILLEIEKKRLYRGKGGQIIRGAVCRFLECLARSAIVLPPPIIVKYQETINECLTHTAEEVQNTAALAFSQISKVYHNSPGLKLVEVTVKYFINELSNFNIGKEVPANISRGAALGLGCLSYTLITTHSKEIIQTLIQATHLKNSASDDAETRRNAANALGDIVATIVSAEKVPNPGNVVFTKEGDVEMLSEHYINDVMEGLFVCMNDYSTDRRGDVGSWVRGAAMSSFQKICDTGIQIPEHYWLQMIGLIIQQQVEKIDRLRQVAGDLMSYLLKKHSLPGWATPLYPVYIHNLHYIQNFQQELEKTSGTHVLPDQSEMPVQSIAIYSRGSLWSVPAFNFPLVLPLIQYAEFRPYMIKGVVVSVGGITESTVKSSTEILVSILRKYPEIGYDILNIYRDCEERLHIPFMKTWEVVLRDCRDLHSLTNLGHEILSRTRQLMHGTKDIHKWMASVGVYSGLLDNSETTKEALRVLVLMLCQAFPKVRHLAASSLYTYMIGLPDHSSIVSTEDELEELITLLTSTSWGLSIKEVRPVRNRICEMLGIEPPQVKEPTAKEVQRKQEDDSYKSLVKDVGY